MDLSGPGVPSEIRGRVASSTSSSRARIPAASIKAPGRTRTSAPGNRLARHNFTYTEDQVRRFIQAAARLAKERSGDLTVVSKEFRHPVDQQAVAGLRRRRRQATRHPVPHGRHRSSGLPPDPDPRASTCRRSESLRRLLADLAAVLLGSRASRSAAISPTGPPSTRPTTAPLTTCVAPIARTRAARSSRWRCRCARLCPHARTRSRQALAPYGTRAGERRRRRAVPDYRYSCESSRSPALTLAASPWNPVRVGRRQRPMRAALLVDLQRDFLAAPGLEPPAGALVDGGAALLDGCRRARRLCRSRLDDDLRRSRQPPEALERREERWMCVAGTAGHGPPACARAPQRRAGRPQDLLQPASGRLRRGIAAADTDVVAGVIRSLRAPDRARGLRRRGYGLMAADAVGSDDPLHAASRAAASGARACPVGFQLSSGSGGTPRLVPPCRVAVATPSAVAAAARVERARGGRARRAERPRGRARKDRPWPPRWPRSRQADPVRQLEAEPSSRCCASWRRAPPGEQPWPRAQTCGAARTASSP